MSKKIALITGSYGGLGSCFAELHASRGGDLVLVGRNQDKLDEQAAKLTQRHGVTAHTIAVDLSQSSAAQIIFDTCERNGWQVDYLLNNAGFGGQGDFTRERTMEQDMSMIAVDVETPTRLLKLFLPGMVERGSGRVLNVSSTAAIMPGPLQAVYYATKAYLTSLSESLWRELKGTGVTVTCLEPGAMQTGFASASDMTGTKLFSHAVNPMAVAKDGYEGMLKGKLLVVSGLPGAQRPLMALAPLMPKKMMLDFVYDQQVAGSAGYARK